MLWSKTFDTNGVHEILLTNQNDARFGKSEMTIDRFDLQVPNTAAEKVTLNASSRPSVTPEPGSSSSVPIVAIVGAITGAAVIFIGLLWFLLRRRHQKRLAQEEFIQPRPDPQINPSPFRDPPSIPTNTAFTTTRSQIQSPYPLTSPSASLTFSPVVSRLSTTPSSPRKETDTVEIRILDDFSDIQSLPHEYDLVFWSSRSSPGQHSGLAQVPVQLASSGVLDPSPLAIASLSDKV